MKQITGGMREGWWLHQLELLQSAYLTFLLVDVDISCV